VFTRAGAVAATFHDEVRALSPEVAGGLYHEQAGWTLVRVGESLQPARVVRHGDWLVGAIARSPAAAVWALKTAVAWLWGLLGLLLVRPPRFDRRQLTTFGGRLRLLVATGVVLPLVILTLFLHLRLVSEERRLEQAFGLEGLRSARYTSVYLAGGVPADDDLARWLATGWGGEAALFDGAQAVAVSRPDLMQVGVLPELPAEEAYISYLLGRDDAIVIREPERLVAAGPVQLEDRRLLLQLYRIDPIRAREGPGAVDWLLTGAVLAALVVLVVTARIEQRLSASLRNLVRLADTLLRGEPPGDVARPPETDLAGVLDAVRSMHEEVRRREASLRHQEELLRVTLSTLAPAVMVLEADGSVRFANPAAERLLDAQREEVLGCIREAASDDRSGGGASVRTVSPRPGEETRWRVGVADAPLPDGRRGLIAVVDDVTDLVQADRLRQLNQLARIVAHEVKNPLTPIRLWVQELDEARRRTDPLDALVEEAGREISSQVDRLQETANSFSNLVALEQWSPEGVDLGAVIADVVRGLAVVERRGVRLERDVPDQPVRVTGDRQWLRRAVSNLVANSLDAIGDGAGTVRLSVRAEGGTAVLEVADSGGGVPDDQLPDLFEPHFSTTSGGSGLGLALVRHIATRCHGRVTATNGRDGLVVRLEIPLLG
jgi:nitrogen-specific signal transduction histidine kinase